MLSQDLLGLGHPICYFSPPFPIWFSVRKYTLTFELQFPLAPPPLPPSLLARLCFFPDGETVLLWQVRVFRAALLWHCADSFFFFFSQRAFLFYSSAVNPWPESLSASSYEFFLRDFLLTVNP